MAGREIVYATSNEANGFAALPDENVKADIIYLCSPNNPTGSAYNAEQLKTWVDYALKNDAIILYDSAYEAFITEDLPRSILQSKVQESVQLKCAHFQRQQASQVQDAVTR